MYWKLSHDGRNASARSSVYFPGTWRPLTTFGKSNVFVFFISFIYTGTLHSAMGRFSMSSSFHILHWLYISVKSMVTSNSVPRRQTSYNISIHMYTHTCIQTLYHPVGCQTRYVQQSLFPFSHFFHFITYNE